ncbi:MAG: ATP-binding protein, partial [Anaerolineae bacterium]
IMLALATFLYVQLQRNMLAQVDAAMQLAVSQSLINIDAENGRLAFQNIENLPDAGAQFLKSEYTISLLGQDGTVWDTLGRNPAAPVFPPTGYGFATQTRQDDEWRVYSQDINTGGVQGWVQIVRSLETVQETLDQLFTLLLWGSGGVLALAGFGGYFLAGRALRPIDRITRTAQAITGSDLHQRINYTGPADEVGRLAATFDSMLNRLQKAFARERRFTGDAAHELRTPLTALKGRLEVTLTRPRSAAEYTATLEEMAGQVERLIHLSNDLLFMARLDQGKRPLQLEPVALRDFFGAIVEQVSPLAGAKQIELCTTIPDDLTLQGDIDLLIRLFLNLLDNAIKFTPEGGKVAVAAQWENGQVNIAISDTGPGIPAEHLPHLFERFYRVEGDRTRRRQDHSQGGAGLGLAIAYEIARAHGGQLAVESQSNQGTVFIVHLPTP